MSLAKRNGTPSDLAAQGTLDDARIKTFDIAVQAPTVATFGFWKAPCSGRVLRIEGRLKVAASGDGAGGNLTCNVRKGGATIQSAVMTFAQADGDNNDEVAGLKTDHADYEAAEKAIKFNSGDVFDLNVAAIQAGATPATGLIVQVTILV
jgi:hypothetical protein